MPAGYSTPSCTCWTGRSSTPTASPSPPRTTSKSRVWNRASRSPPGTAPPSLTALLTGPALGTRIFGGRPPSSRLIRIPWKDVADVGIVIRLGVRGSSLDADWVERWVRDIVQWDDIARIGPDSVALRRDFTPHDPALPKRADGT
ncbi:hypothetical protein ACFVTM_18510 [Arthrobacter sp. NPDC058130]|uniref:hypothetical protein n=1 Tax=Arthrobacter sp. NPDC058130 TaxID=3346353 RepID=UPI0036EA277C